MYLIENNNLHNNDIPNSEINIVSDGNNLMKTEVFLIILL